MKNGFDKSLEYIHELYQIKKMLRKKNYQKIFDLKQIFDSTQKEIGKVLGPKIPYEKISEYERILETDPFTRTQEEEIIFNELATHLKTQVYRKFLELQNLALYPIDLDPLTPLYSSFDDLSIDFSKIRINPLKLIFNIWHKALKQNPNGYSKIKIINDKLIEYKEKMKGTDKEYLFSSLNENTNFESLRKKSLYGVNKAYNDIADFIYQKSTGYFFDDNLKPKD